MWLYWSKDLRDSARPSSTECQARYAELYGSKTVKPTTKPSTATAKPQTKPTRGVPAKTGDN